jgi:hypothetical protein
MPKISPGCRVLQMLTLVPPQKIVADAARRAVSTQGSPAPLRISLPSADKTLPHTTGLREQPDTSRSESLPSPFPSESNSSLSASTYATRSELVIARPTCPVVIETVYPRRLANERTARRPSTPNANASSSPLSALRRARAVAKSPVRPRSTCLPSPECAGRARIPTCNVLEQGSGLGCAPRARLSRAHSAPRGQHGMDIWWLR